MCTKTPPEYQANPEHPLKPSPSKKNPPIPLPISKKYTTFATMFLGYEASTDKIKRNRL